MQSQIVDQSEDWHDRYERFDLGAWQWNVTGAKHVLRDHPERVGAVPLSIVAPAARNFVRTDPDWIREMPEELLERPLIFASVPGDEHWRRLLIDGYHRLNVWLLRHESDDEPDVPVFILTHAESKRLYCGRGNRHSPYWGHKPQDGSK